MSDTAHNTIVTIILILAIIIAIALFFRGFRTLGYNTNYQYYPASATVIERIPVYTSSVTSYSRPSTPVRTHSTTSSTTDYTSYNTTYSYSYPAPQVTYYGTGYTVPHYSNYNHYYSDYSYRY